MKKMLIIEEPESCETCPLRSYSNLMLMCTPMREAASDVKCPLKPMPTKISTKDITGDDEASLMERSYIYGRNDCIQELEKC